MDDEAIGFGIEEITNYKIVNGKIVFGKDDVKRVSLNPKKEKVSKPKKKTSVKKRKVKEEDEVDEETLKSQKKQKMAEISSDISLDDMIAWKGMHIPHLLLMGLQKNGMTSPTPIQSLTLPSAIRDHLNILGAAPTGSGKTLAFSLPILTSLILDNFDCQDNLYALIITPTRELAKQITQHIENVSNHIPLKISTIVGGLAPQKQERELKKKPHIIVATPGRLWDLWKTGSEHLTNCGKHLRYLVVDEADRMIEAAHFDDLNKILDQLAADQAQGNFRQTFVYSATLTVVHKGPQRYVKKKGGRTVDGKIQEILDRLNIKKKPKIVDLTAGEKEEIKPENLLEAKIYCSSLEDKDVALFVFLQSYAGRSLIFVNSKDAVRRLRSILDLLKCPPLLLHADMHQRQRLKHLEKFSSTENAILLATDVAARGLDIENVQHVIHYNVPRTAETYIHRSGRTARANKSGISILLVTHDDMRKYKNILMTLKKDDLNDFPLDLGHLKVAKERVNLARQIDVEQHRVRKTNVTNRWFEQAAEEAGIILDERQIVDEGIDAADFKRRNQYLKKELNELLKQPLTRISTKYPDLIVKKQNDTDNAVKLAKERAIKKK
ncbi:DgyrCDS7302 [Dimorphilus gyrociliatus]|uniref:ATP-dependent RNA helicase n=1 Tax=Dimorphilus gyrociliatus TaxID=2664684 RepID=A0A7I8VT97_9ANNE|nr:DgyrCDS7302 [Dimorphilus gyrociliatus]